MGFNARQYREENPIQSTLPVGWYKVKVETSELKQTDEKKFNMVTMSIRIVDSISGHFINGLRWENLVIGHESESVRRFANEKLTEIMIACGVEELDVWSQIAEEGGEFAMSIGRSQRTGREYAVYRPISAWVVVCGKEGRSPDTKPREVAAPDDMPPAPPLDMYAADIDFELGNFDE